MGRQDIAVPHPAVRDVVGPRPSSRSGPCFTPVPSRVDVSMLVLSATLLCHSLVLPSRQPLRQARPRQQQPPLMGGGIKQPRPTEPFDPTARPPAVDSLPEEAVLPRLIVFDLDNTLWTPELYTLRFDFRFWLDPTQTTQMDGFFETGLRRSLSSEVRLLPGVVEDYWDRDRVPLSEKLRQYEARRPTAPGCAASVDVQPAAWCSVFSPAK